MENEKDVIKEELRIGVMGGIDYLLNTIQNTTYEEFNANRENYEKSFLTSFSYIFGDFVNETFNRIAENKKLGKQKQKSIIEICFKVFKEWENEYIAQCQKFGNGNENK